MKYTDLQTLFQLFTLEFMYFIVIFMIIVSLLNIHILTLEKAAQDTIIVLLSACVAIPLIIFNDYSLVDLAVTFLVTHYVYDRIRYIRRKSKR